MITSKPVAADILCASAIATTATLVTVPAGRWYTADVSISASCGSASITATPAVTWTPNDASCGPSVTTVLARVTVISIASAPQQGSRTTGILVYGGNTGGVLSFATNSATTASVTINGFLL
jgi:hypothetical protein